VADENDIKETYLGDPIDIAAVKGAEAIATLLVLAGPNAGEVYAVEEAETIIGRIEGSQVRLPDGGVSRVHCKLLQTDFGFEIEDLDSRNGTFLNGQRIQQGTLKDGDKLQIGRTTILKFAIQDQLERRFQRQMANSAMRDPLTQVLNRRYFLERLESEFHFASRHGVPLGLLVVDIDHFKDVNDNYGDLAGNETLKALASYIDNAIRSEDVFARYGNEEFALVTRNLSPIQCQQLAERICVGARKLTVSCDGAEFSVTISIGIACFPDNRVKSAVELVAAAEKALAAAKDKGRDRVEVYADLPPDPE
jgi:diguanylate cyclase (GGDEF)-like protein